MRSQSFSAQMCPKSELYEKLYSKSVQSDESTGELTAYNFLSGRTYCRYRKRKTVSRQNTQQQTKPCELYANFNLFCIRLTFNGYGNTLKRKMLKINTVCGHGGFFQVGMCCTKRNVGSYRCTRNGNEKMPARAAHVGYSTSCTVHIERRRKAFLFS